MWFGEFNFLPSQRILKIPLTKELLNVAPHTYRYLCMLHLSMSSVFSEGWACVHACVTHLKGSSVLRLASMTREQQYHQVGLTVAGHTHHGWTWMHRTSFHPSHFVSMPCNMPLVPRFIEDKHAWGMPMWVDIIIKLLILKFFFFFYNFYGFFY